MKNIIIILAIISLSSCITQRRCNDKFPPMASTTIKDSTVITHEIRFYDSIIYKVVEIPKFVIRDSIIIRYENTQATADKLYLKGRYSEAVIWMQNNILKGQLTESGWLSIEIKLQLQEKTIKELREKTSTTIQIKQVRYIPKFIKILAWISGIELILLFLFIAYKIAKVYFKVNIPFIKI